MHHYELSNWTLYARAYAKGTTSDAARAVDTSLRQADDSLEWLEKNWLT